jgi:hypothetical protein
MHTVRIVLAVVLALFALLIWYCAFTVPAVAATSYLILALVVSTATYFVSPFRFHRAKTQ